MIAQGLTYKLLPLIGLFMGLTLFSAVVHAQQTNKVSLNFPIKDLGGCANVADCRTYCQDPVNHDNCVNYAKNKGFYSSTSVQQQLVVALSHAQQDLGCNSLDTCKSFCEQSGNLDKCSQFAQQYNLAKNTTLDQKQTVVLDKAKAVLGCDSISSCMNLCSQSNNQQKCTNFAQQTGLSGGQVSKGPGGCLSPDTCKTYCSDPNNFKVCSQFVNQVSSSGSPSLNPTSSAQPQISVFKGPGGCTSESSCKDYCSKNPDMCHFMRNNYSQSSNSPNSSSVPNASFIPNFSSLNSSNLEKYCNLTPNCSWNQGSCKCQMFNSPNNNSNNGYQNSSPVPYTGNPEAQCKSGPGCTWNGNSCNCINNFNNSNSWSNTQPNNQYTIPPQNQINSNQNPTSVNSSTNNSPKPSTNSVSTNTQSNLSTTAPNPTPPQQTNSTTNTSQTHTPPPVISCSGPQDCCSKYGGTWNSTTQTCTPH